MGREDRKSDMPIRDADLRQAAWAGRVTVGDPLWRLLTELQNRRDLDREPAGSSLTAERRREIP